MFDIETYLDSLPEDREDIIVSGKGITYLDVTRFKNLKILCCDNNNLTSLYLNENLKELYCQHNRLTSLHLNEKLEKLYCSNNQLTSLYLNKNLKTLYCRNNQLTSLHLNANLELLHCYYNQLTSLHLNEKLEYLYCYNNHLTSLYLNENLKILYCSNNPIYEIIRGNTHTNTRQNLRVLNRFRYLYYCLKFKKRFRDLLWIKIREPKIRERYSHDYLIVNLHEDTDLDDLLENW